MRFRYRMVSCDLMQVEVRNVFTEATLDYHEAVQLLQEFQNFVEELEAFIDQHPDHEN